MGTQKITRKLIKLKNFENSRISVHPAVIAIVGQPIAKNYLCKERLIDRCYWVRLSAPASLSAPAHQTTLDLMSYFVDIFHKNYYISQVIVKCILSSSQICLRTRFVLQIKFRSQS